MVPAGQIAGHSHAGRADEVEEGEVVGVGNPLDAAPQHVLGPERAGHGEYRSQGEGPFESPGAAFGRRAPLQALVLVHLVRVGGKTLDQSLADDGGQTDCIADRREETEADDGNHGGGHRAGDDGRGADVPVGDQPREQGRRESSKEIGGGRKVRHHGAGPEFVGQSRLNHAHVDHRRREHEDAHGDDVEEAVAAAHLGSREEVRVRPAGLVGQYWFQWQPRHSKLVPWQGRQLALSSLILARAMKVGEFLRVVCGAQVRSFQMAIAATEGVVDLRVADQAVRHHTEGEWPHSPVESPVAGRTAFGLLQQGPNIRWAQIFCRRRWRPPGAAPGCPGERGIHGRTGSSSLKRSIGAGRGPSGLPLPSEWQERHTAGCGRI